MARARRGTGSPSRPESMNHAELTWDDLDYWWSRDKVLREIQVTPCEGGVLVGRTGKEFARLEPTDREGVLHMYERNYEGKEEKYPQYEVWTRTMLVCQLNLAASSAKWRSRKRKDVRWKRTRKQT